MHKDGFGIGGTRLGTGAAADAVSVIHDGIENVAFIHKGDGFRRTDFYAGAAILVIPVNNTSVF